MLVLGLLFGKYHFKLNVFVKDTKSQYYDVCSWHKKKHVHDKKITSCEKIYNDSWTLTTEGVYFNNSFLRGRVVGLFKRSVFSREYGNLSRIIDLYNATAASALLPLLGFAYLRCFRFCVILTYLCISLIGLKPRARFQRFRLDILTIIDRRQQRTFMLMRNIIRVCIFYYASYWGFYIHAFNWLLNFHSSNLKAEFVENITGFMKILNLKQRH